MKKLNNIVRILKLCAWLRLSLEPFYSKNLPTEFSNSLNTITFYTPFLNYSMVLELQNAYHRDFHIILKCHIKHDMWKLLISFLFQTFHFLLFNHSLILSLVSIPIVKTGCCGLWSYNCRAYCQCDGQRRKEIISILFPKGQIL